MSFSLALWNFQMGHRSMRNYHFEITLIFFHVCYDLFIVQPFKVIVCYSWSLYIITLFKRIKQSILSKKWATTYLNSLNSWKEIMVWMLSKYCCLVDTSSLYSSLVIIFTFSFVASFRKSPGLSCKLQEMFQEIGDSTQLRLKTG